MSNKKYTLVDDRTTDEVKLTVGFVKATDKFMSGWGKALGKSVIAVPFTSADDMDKVMERINRRNEMKRVRVVMGNEYHPSLNSNDHLHIYNTTTSFRYTI